MAGGVHGNKLDVARLRVNVTELVGPAHAKDELGARPADGAEADVLRDALKLDATMQRKLERVSGLLDVNAHGAVVRGAGKRHGDIGVHGRKADAHNVLGMVLELLHTPRNKVVGWEIYI